MINLIRGYVLKTNVFRVCFKTRNLVKDGSKYFGPYTSVNMVNIMLDLVRQLYPLRTCNLQLSETNIKSHKFKVCLEYHIGNCKGPCEGLQSEEDLQRVGWHDNRHIKG